MPTDDPTDPADSTPVRRRVSGAALLDAIEALPDRIAARVGGGGGSDETGDDDSGSSLPPEVTFEAEPPPEPDPEATPEPIAPIDDRLNGTSRRRSGFPRRRR